MTPGTDPDAVRVKADDDLRHIREVVARTRAEQGLPPKVRDPVVLQAVIDVLYGCEPAVPRDGESR